MPFSLKASAICAAEPSATMARPISPPVISRQPPQGVDGVADRAFQIELTATDQSATILDGAGEVPRTHVGRLVGGRRLQDQHDTHGIGIIRGSKELPEIVARLLEAGRISLHIASLPQPG